MMRMQVLLGTSFDLHFQLYLPLEITKILSPIYAHGIQEMETLTLGLTLHSIQNIIPFHSYLSKLSIIFESSVKRSLGLQTISALQHSWVLSSLYFVLEFFMYLPLIPKQLQVLSVRRVFNFFTLVCLKKGLNIVVKQYYLLFVGYLY